MKFSWFRRYGLLFLPVSVMGWIVLVALVAIAVFLFINIDSSSHSVSDTLRPFVIELFLIFIVYSVIGYLTSRKN